MFRTASRNNCSIFENFRRHPNLIAVNTMWSATNGNCQTTLLRKKLKNLNMRQFQDIGSTKSFIPTMEKMI